MKTNILITINLIVFALCLSNTSIAQTEGRVEGRAVIIPSRNSLELSLDSEIDVDLTLVLNGDEFESWAIPEIQTGGEEVVEIVSFSDIATYGGVEMFDLRDPELRKRLRIRTHILGAAAILIKVFITSNGLAAFAWVVVTIAVNEIFPINQVIEQAPLSVDLLAIKES